MGGIETTTATVRPSAKAANSSAESSRPVLITGSHRSGTTWVGRVLGASPEFGYIHEPFNREGTLGLTSRPFDKWYMHLCDENAADYSGSLQDCLAFQYKTWAGLPRMQEVRDLGRIVRDMSLFRLYRWQRRRPLVKDPLALFSAEWLAKRFGMQVLVMIRHPAAFVGSLVKAGWDFPFHDLASQTLLVNGLLAEFREEIDRLARNPVDRIEQGIALWRFTHHAIRRYQETQPGWHFVRHEDLSLEPEPQFRQLTKLLGVGFEGAVQNKLRQLSFASRKATTSSTKDLRINSSANVSSWKQRLSPEAIARIREATGGVWPTFYSDADWD